MSLILLTSIAPRYIWLIAVDLILRGPPVPGAVVSSSFEVTRPAIFITPRSLHWRRSLILPKTTPVEPLKHGRPRVRQKPPDETVRSHERSEKGRRRLEPCTQRRVDHVADSWQDEVHDVSADDISRSKAAGRPTRKQKRDHYHLHHHRFCCPLNTFSTLTRWFSLFFPHHQQRYFFPHRVPRAPKTVWRDPNIPTEWGRNPAWEHAHQGVPKPMLNLWPVNCDISAELWRHQGKRLYIHAISNDLQTAQHIRCDIMMGVWIEKIRSIRK